MSDNPMIMIIDGTTYEYSVDDFIKLCEGELSAPENVLRHVLRLQKIAADNVAAEMRSLRADNAELRFTIEQMTPMREEAADKPRGRHNKRT